MPMEYMNDRARLAAQGKCPVEMEVTPAVESPWRSMDDAPLNGTQVDLIDMGERAANCSYNYILKRWERFWINRNGGMSWIEVIKPTHWMPIPKPPAE